jgi:hypothetical protein
MRQWLLSMHTNEHNQHNPHNHLTIS